MINKDIKMSKYLKAKFFQVYGRNIRSQESRGVHRQPMSYFAKKSEHVLRVFTVQRAVEISIESLARFGSSSLVRRKKNSNKWRDSRKHRLVKICD